jgi:hypothetical protein
MKKIIEYLKKEYYMMKRVLKKSFREVRKEPCSEQVIARGTSIILGRIKSIMYDKDLVESHLPIHSLCTHIEKHVNFDRNMVTIKNGSKTLKVDLRKKRMSYEHESKYEGYVKEKIEIDIGNETFKGSPHAKLVHIINFYEQYKKAV